MPRENLINRERFDSKNTLFIKGTSMYPFLRNADIVFFEEVLPHHLRIGDIISFDYNQNGNYIVHRILEIKKNETGLLNFLTKGDNNESYDIELPQDKLTGKAKTILRGSKSIHLDSLRRKIYSKINVFFSKNNITYKKIIAKPLAVFLKNFKPLSSIISLFYSTDISISIYDHSLEDQSLLKGFSGKFCFATSLIKFENDNLIISNWRMKYPFYQNKLGAQFLEKLIEYAHSSGKRQIIYKKFSSQNPAFDLIRQLKLASTITTDNNDLTIPIN